MEDEKKYHALGESGILVDEDGNWVDWNDEKPARPSSPSPTPAQPTSFLDKTNPAYWDFYYDERYCGPSREAYIERMVKQYSTRKEKSPTTTSHYVAPSVVEDETPFDDREFDALVDQYAPSPYKSEPKAPSHEKTYWDHYAENRRRKLRDWEKALIFLAAALLAVLLLFSIMGRV